MGIDYGLGMANIDHETGIRYGVIPANDVLQSWSDSAESDYGPPTCGECGNEAVPIDHEGVPDMVGPDYDDDDNPIASDWKDEGREYACLTCRKSFDGDEAYGDDPLGFNLDDGEYVAHQGGDDTDVFVLKSPFYTFAPFCSPCAPGACYLRDGGEGGDDRAYCFDPSWFDCWDLDDCTGEYEGQKTSCPYPVYRVSDDVCIFTPRK